LVLIALTIGLSTGCKNNQPLNPQTVKILLQTAAVTFEAAIVVTNPNWNQAKFDADINATIAAWQVGATWQQNVINLLAPVSADIALIPNCDNKCQALVTVFGGAIQTVIADLQAQQGTPTKASLKPKYASWAEYREAWNPIAPQGKQLPTLEQLGL